MLALGFRFNKLATISGYRTRIAIGSGRTPSTRHRASHTLIVKTPVTIPPITIV
ncbi:hypothetical protein Q777_GL000067 [Lacticaseibacillus rhamnosus DSM 20021 = JCM 1136 = NBRC 3425]|nr:hypothetical protein Q777_GL000067 [Lacticaseibacillus rhamnosus DSM 20021 = JCM 1136 = NBRC 3425]